MNENDEEIKEIGKLMLAITRLITSEPHTEKRAALAFIAVIRVAVSLAVAGCQGNKDTALQCIVAATNQAILDSRHWLDKESGN